MATTNNVFDYSGIVSVSDLREDSFKNTLQELDQFQKSFSSDYLHLINNEYRQKWPINPLYWWSRIWEYPYVYHHLLKLKAEVFAGRATMADLGSGVTFFPFLLEKNGFDVTCLDTDPVCIECLDKIIATNKSPKVSAKLISNGAFPNPDKYFDIVYCISVLEHVDNFSAVIKEILRSLKDDGYLILTIDLDLNGLLEIGPERHAKLIKELETHFEYFAPLRVIHPSLNLTNRNSPYPWIIPTTLTSSAKNMVKRMLNRKSTNTNFHLAVQTLVLKRKKNS